MNKKKALEIGTLVLLSYKLRKHMLELDIKRDDHPEDFIAIGEALEVAEQERSRVSEKLRKYGVDVLF